ncbi:hypothetical protein [Kitasatospora arboriphila]|uniref:Molecular chaperone DnaJ n=1 Tax=Kitasatospora arboriphila TaxID=258052 RepID=A0ABN1UAA3_9ACTN
MMHQHTRTPGPICPACDGFARAAIATGTRRADGTRHTIPVACPACRGLGTLHRTPAAVVRA